MNNLAASTLSDSPSRDFSGGSAPRGLDDSEAAARLKAEGPNELPRSGQRTLLRIAMEVVREPMLLLLLGGGAIYLALGDLGEALILLTFACLSVVITIVQESRTERVLEALRDLTSPRALVVREGRRLRIPGREVVRGDVLALSEGDRTPADAHILQARDLLADESLLTGESAPVRKLARSDPQAKAAARPGGDDLPMVFSGSLIVRGEALAETFATGPRSEIGKIGQSLEALEIEPPRLQAQTRRLVRLFAVIGGGVSLLAVLLYGLTRGDWLQAALGGIALGMAMLPEEFPVVLTVFMAMGAWRISQARVLTRRAAAIETLGAATVLCTDKTGTLTENRMSVAQMRLAGGDLLCAQNDSAPDVFHDLIETARLASAQNPVDPMERAFHSLTQRTQNLDARTQHWRLVYSYGLRPDLLAMSQVWKSPHDSDLIIACKGAPEAVAALCRMDEADAALMRAAIDSMAADGLRVLGIARASFAGEDMPERQHDFVFEFLGLAGLADPLRAHAREAVRECRSAGVSVIMITGDHPSTAQAIARQAGIESDEVITGERLDALSADELAARAGRGIVFARILPEQKLRIVEALQARGEIVAMTGDGVTDAPSLKAAHIGIAMGGRGTDVAREAASMVLLDDDFSSIVKAIRLGRRIYDNLRKAMGFIFAVHVPIAGLALLPLAFGLPTLLGPVHIAFLEMVIDPACSLVFEAQGEEDDVMARPPRNPEEPLFSWGLIAWGLTQGAVAFVLVAGVYLYAVQREMPVDEVRTLGFFCLVTAIVVLIFANRSFSASLASAFRQPGPALVAVLLGVPFMLALLLAWPEARALFRLGPMHLHDLAIMLSVGALLLLILETIKWVAARMAKARAA
jgi:Ca2+-transporting ATPase